MSFPSELTTGRLTQLRQLRHSSDLFLLLTPNTVIWQTQPASTVDGSLPYAEFEWSGTDAGDRTDVKTGMTVLISSTSDYLTTTFFRGRVRLAPDSTLFYINETSVNLVATDYVTVLDDYDIHERLERRLANNAQYIDWDISFTKLPPLIANLQSTYVDTSGGATASFDFAPTVTAMESGASISTYLWDVADGTITTGTSASKDITVSFPGASTNEHRWVRLTATDNEGTAQYFTFEVFTINPHSASSNVVKLAVGDIGISATSREGYNASIRAWSGVSTVLDRTRCSVVSIDDYNGVKQLAFTSGGTTEIEVGDTIEGATSGATAVVVAVDLVSGTWAGGNAVGTLWVNEQVGTFEAENLDVGASANLATIADDSVFTYITQNVCFVGRLQRESSLTSGDSTYGQSQNTTLNIQGFASQLALTIAPGLLLTRVADSDAWGEISSMTIGLALYYEMVWYSTFLNLCSLTFPSDIADYEWNEFVLPPASMAQWINDLSDDINAYLVFSASGECTIQRHASYAGVAGLDTIATFGENDLLSFTLDLDYVPTNTQAIAGAGTFNTTTNESTVWKGRAPAQVYGPGWELATLDQQIMKSDITETEAKAEVGLRVANHLAYINPKARLTATFPSGYYWIVASDHLLYAFDIPATDNTRGRVYTSGDKWLCVSVDYGYDNTVGAWTGVNAVFEIVTVGGNYGITVTQVINVNDLTPPDLPPLGAGLGASDPLSNYPLEDPDFELPGGGSGQGQPSNPEEVQVGCDLLNVNIRTGVQRATHNATVNSEIYMVNVKGFGKISDAGTSTYDFTDLTDITFNTGSLDGTKGNPAPCATSANVPDNSGFPWNGSGSSGPGIDVRVDLASPSTVTAVSFQYYNDTNSTVLGLRIIYMDNTDTEITRTTTTPNEAQGVWRTRSDGVNVDNVAYILFVVFRHGPGVTGTIQIDNLSISSDSDVNGDAFYYGFQNSSPQLYTGTLGFRIDGAKPGTIPLYSPTHNYTFPMVGDGTTFVFDFDDSDYTDNDNINLVVTVCGAGMALTTL